MIRTRRWNDPVEKGDGTRILVCRYRPRGVKKADETWDEWVPELGPSRALHGEVYSDAGLPWDEYRRSTSARSSSVEPPVKPSRCSARRPAATRTAATARCSRL
jgi:uncharacterized protein YeaO (DUF488 family)